MSVDGGMTFDRGVNWFGQSLTQTLEPRLFYVYAPYRNQNQIPVFDTGAHGFQLRADLYREPLRRQRPFRRREPGDGSGEFPLADSDRPGDAPRHRRAAILPGG